MSSVITAAGQSSPENTKKIKYSYESTATELKQGGSVAL